YRTPEEALAVIAALGRSRCSVEGDVLQRRTLAWYGAKIQYSPDDLEAKRGRAMLLEAVGRGPEATELCREVARRQPQGAAAQRAVHFCPGDGDARYYLSYAFYMHGQYAEGAGEARAAIRINPGDARAHEGLGECLARMGRMREARAEWELALNLQPHSQFA